MFSPYELQKIIGDHVSGVTGVGGEEEDDDGPEQQPQRAGHAPAGESIHQIKAPAGLSKTEL